MCVLLYRTLIGLVCRYGPCWLGALAQLDPVCSKLTDETHARLALQFANCLLAQVLHYLV